MITFRVTTPFPPSSIDPGSLNNTYDETPLKRDLGVLLIKLGQKIFENDLTVEWLSMSQVCALCRRYRLQWQRGVPRAKDLEYQIHCYIDNHADIMGGGIKVHYQTEGNGEIRNPKLLLRFYQMSPEGYLL